MKNIALILSIAIVLLFSCRKANEKPLISIKLSSDIDNPSSLFFGLRNESNKEDDKINLSLYYSSLAISNLLKKPEYKNYILDKSKYSESKELSLDIILNDEKLLKEYNDVIYIYGSEKGFENYNDILENMVYEGVQYFPIIYYYNIESSDISSEKTFVGVGESVDENDNIPAYTISFKNELKETLIKEKDFERTEPILIISNHTDYVDESVDKITLESNNKNYIADKYKIAYRYERNGNSDYRQSHRILYSSGNYTSTASGYTIKSIPSNKINYLYTQDVSLPEVGDGFWFATYERDWYSSQKGIYVGKTNGAPQALHVGGRMKYYNEYYQRLFINFKTRKNLATSAKGYLRIMF